VVADEAADGSGIVDVLVRLDQSLVSDNDFDSVALVEVSAIEPPPNVSTTVHVALVLDTSGSMEGRRMENAVQAAHELVDRLDVGDRFSLVSYGDAAQTLVECMRLGRNRDEAHEAIDAMVAEGNTCISCGLQAGYDALNTCRDASVERVILMSDGHANRGIVDEPSLRQLVASARQYWGVETSAIGLGRLHDEVRMAALAEAGAADYYFVHNSDYFAEVLDREIADLHSTAVTNVMVALRPGDGITISGTPMLGGTWNGDELLFDLGQMAVGETRQLAVQLALPVGEPGRALSARVAFYDAAGRLYRVAGSARLERSEDAAAIESSIDAEVVNVFSELRAAAAMDEALLQFEQGQQAQAVDTLNAARESVNTYATSMTAQPAPATGSLDSMVDEVRDADGSYFEQERGEVLLQRAINNERRRGRAAPSPMYAPEAMDLQRLE
jgi:Ca-activated chloride channel family protein